MGLTSGEYPEYKPGSPIDPRSWRILEAGIKAIGGIKALRKMKGLSITITYSTYKDKIYFMKPNLLRRDSEFPWAKFKIAYDGKVSTRTTGAEDKTDIKEKKGQTPAVKWLRHRIDQTLLYPLLERGAKIKYEGISFVEDEPCEVIRVAYKDGWTCKMHFQEKNYLVAKIEYRKGGSEPQRQNRYFRSYQKVGRIKLPHTIRGENQLTGVVSKAKPKYKVNPKLKESFFNLHAASHTK
ncbi:MAG: hypothetical protein E3J72_06300 [Planctomycetota bacterium]|nr:MAG: hypothetical protein E3J72_06300 [Planctomycetota bacterium]